MLTRRRFMAGTILASTLPFLFTRRATTMANDTPDFVSPGSSDQSVSDPLSFQPIIDHARRRIVQQAGSEYSQGQWGRVLIHDDGEHAQPQWATISGTLASDTTAMMSGDKSLKLTSAVGAGGTVDIRKFTRLVADQSVSTFPQIVLEVFVKFADANLRDIQLFFRPDDTQQRWQAAMRFLVKQAGVSQMQLQYLDSTGTFQNALAYTLAQGGGSVGDEWHHFMMALDYKQGSAGYLTYALLRVDDGDVTFASGTGPGAQKLGTNNVRQTAWDIIATCDTAAVSTVVNVDEIMAGDLSNTFNQ